MASATRDRDREWLKRELQSCEYQELLRSLQRTEHFLRQFETWADVIAFMRAGTSTDPLKDEILRPIFRAHKDDRDPCRRTVLLVIFWPGLESLSCKKRRWDEDPDDLWQNIVLTFLSVVSRLDVNRRPARLVQKIVNDTIHNLYEGYGRRWKRTNREVPINPQHMEGVTTGRDGVDIEAIDLRAAYQQQVSKLREHLSAGRISEPEFFMLLGTRLHGSSLAEYARAGGLDYEVAKKRRLRLEARLRRLEDAVR